MVQVIALEVGVEGNLTLDRELTANGHGVVNEVGGVIPAAEIQDGVAAGGDGAHAVCITDGEGECGPFLGVVTQF